MIPDKIARADTLDELYDALGGYIPAEIFANCSSAFESILRRAAVIGEMKGVDDERRRLRNLLKLN